MTIEDLQQENKSYGYFIETYNNISMRQNSTRVKEFTEHRILELEKAIAENMEKLERLE